MKLVIVLFSAVWYSSLNCFEQSGAVDIKHDTSET